MEPIEQLVDRFERRLRLQRTLSGLVEGACVGLMVAAVVVAAVRTGWLDASFWWMAVAAGLVSTTLGAALRASRPIDPVAAARRLDRTHDLHDRLSTAVALAGRDDRTADDDAFVRAQLQDAIDHVDRVDLASAAPWKSPPDTRLLALVSAGVLGLAVAPMPDHQHPLPPPQFEAEHQQVLDDATLVMERERLDEFRRRLEDLDDDEAEQLADEVEQLLDAVEHREISDREFADRVDELLDEYAVDEADERQLEVMSDALSEAARQVGDDHADTLEEHGELDDALDALEQGDFEEASEQLAELADQFDDESLTDDEAERLADVFDDFADHVDDHGDRLEELYEEHRDRFEELADEFDGDSPHEEQLLEDAREAMEDAADRSETFDESSAGRDLDRLSRELDAAADDLRDDAPEDPESDDGQRQDGDGADGDPEAADDPGETDDGEGDADQERQQPSGGEDPENGQQPPPVADEELADGREEQRDDEPPESDSDEPDYRNEIGRHLDRASDQLDEMEQERQRQQRREEGRRQLEDLKEASARGDREADEQRGEQMEDYLDRARGDDSGDRAPEDGEDGEQMPTEPGDDLAEHDPGDVDSEDVERGDGIGDGGPDDEGAAGEEEDLDFDYLDEQLDGVDGRDGPTRSEIIESAAEDGFATAEYEEVYTDYEDVAEEVMEREDVPDGYRHYIERYFDLIRPEQQ